MNIVPESAPKKLPPLTSKLLSLYSLLDQLGWMIASEDPNKPDTFQLRGRTEIRLGKAKISRLELQSHIENISDKTFLHKTSHLVVWRNIQKSPQQSISFTKREKEIYNHLLSGDSAPTISKELGISRRTVEKHIEHIYKKRGVTSYNKLLFSR